MILVLFACATPPAWSDTVILEGAHRRADRDGDGIIQVGELGGESKADPNGDGVVDEGELKAYLLAMGGSWKLPGWISKAAGRPADVPPAMAWQLMETLRQEVEAARAGAPGVAPLPTREALDVFRVVHDPRNPGAHEALQALILAADEAGVAVPPEVRNLPAPK